LSTGTAHWGRRHGLSPVMQARGLSVCYIGRV
jgi:hypothetical protein